MAAEMNTPLSDLPSEIISNISKHLDSGIDRRQFHSVCNKWHSTSSSSSPHVNTTLLSPLFLPLLIPNPAGHRLPFTDRPVILVARAVFLVKPLSPLSPLSQGFLLTVEEVNPGKLRILYPLSTDRVTPLPSNCPEYLDLSRFRVSQVAKSYGFKYKTDNNDDVPGVIRVVLCSGYTTAMVLYGKGTLIRLSLKSGDWCYIRHSIISSFLDVISDGETHVRAIDCYGDVHVIDHRVAKVVKSIVPRSVIPRLDHVNLLQSNGELFAATYFIESPGEARFKIYRLDEARGEWMNAGSKTECNKVLFVSSYWSFFLYTDDLDLFDSYAKRKRKMMTARSGNNRVPPKSTVDGEYVIYLEKSFPPPKSTYAICSMYEGASLEIGIKVFFFDSNDSGVWMRSLRWTMTDVLWPPPTWFWPDTELSDRDDEEFDIYSSNASPYSMVNASTGVAALNKRGGIESMNSAPSWCSDFDAMAIDDDTDVSTASESSRALSTQDDVNTEHYSTVMFEGLSIKANLVPTLKKVWAKHGNILEGSIIHNSDILSRSAESLATALLILETFSGRSLTETRANYLSTVLCDLRHMNFKVDWLVPFVDKAVLVHKTKPLIDSFVDYNRIKAQTAEMRMKLFDELVKLDEVEQEEDMVSVSERFLVLESIDFDQSLGQGLY